MKKGDEVVVTSGDYKGARGTITSVWGNIVTVQPNENADARSFLKNELKVVKK